MNKQDQGYVALQFWRSRDICPASSAAAITGFDIDTIPDLDRTRQVLAHGWR